MFKERKYNKLMNNIGNVIENDSYVVIDFNNQKLEQLLSLTGNILVIKSKSLINKYNKPLVYNVNNMSFNNVSIIVDENVNFNNCTFVNGINILKADTVLFNNNKYISQKEEYDDEFFQGKNINSIIFYGEEVTDQNIAFRINANSIRLFNSVLLKDNGHINFKCNNLILNDSTIGGETSLIETKKMYILDDSSINSSKNCMITCNKINGDYNINCPRVILNGQLTQNNKKVKIKE